MAVAPDVPSMRFVVGGPPRSGKSVFTAALLWTLRERVRGTPLSGDVAWTTLDLWNDSLAWVLGETVDQPEDPTMEDAKARRDRFAALEHRIVLADAPGIIDDYTRTLLEPADGLIILSRDEEGIEEWKELAGELDIEVVWVLESLDPTGPGRSSWDEDTGFGRFRGAERTQVQGVGLRAVPASGQDVLVKMAVDLLRRGLRS